MPINPIKRIRDRPRSFRPSQVIPYDEWEKIEEKAVRAEQFLNAQNVAYALMWDKMATQQELILSNRIHETQEEHSITETLKRVTIFPKKVQVDEVVGGLLAFRWFIAELQTWIDVRDDLIKQEVSGSVHIQRSKDERSG